MSVLRRSSAALLLAIATLVGGLVNAQPASAALSTLLSGSGPEVASSVDGLTSAWITNGLQLQNLSALAGSIIVRDNQGLHAYGAPGGCSGDAALADTKHLVMSSDGSTIVWVSDSATFACLAQVQAPAPGVTRVYAERGGVVSLVSRSTGGVIANGASDWPSMSADGRQIAFSSAATNLVSGDTNNAPDVFVRDVVANRTVRVSTATHHSGIAKTAISPDGRDVAYQATTAVSGIATSALANLFVVDRKPDANAISFDQRESTRLVAAPTANERSGAPLGFPNANVLAFLGTSNVYLFNLTTGMLQNTGLPSTGLWVVSPSTITQCVDRLHTATFYWEMYTISGSTLTRTQDQSAVNGNYCGSLGVGTVHTQRGMIAPKYFDGTVAGTRLVTWQWQPRGSTNAVNVATLNAHL